ncbi:hypothetical protein H5410_030708 [Solanum commersonii]|uniref:Uncharacterized protein n=1 Tax=Solanum commersonii TaxID=4109 RepID=A0A9J5YGE3_SOLCO|nr:hypothetical protein H5410_030708 [Solanum commersonii]
MKCWHQSYILSLWTEEKRGSAGRGVYHEISEELRTNDDGMLNTCKLDTKHGKRVSSGGWVAFYGRRQIPGLNPGQGMETTKMEYGRGRGNFYWSGEIHRDQKEHQQQKHSAGPTLTLRGKS